MLIDLITSFMKVGLFSVGGGYAAIPLIAEEVVARRGLLTASQFGDLVTIAEMTPGPIAVNAATFVGMRLAGFAGAVAATLGCILPSIVLVSLLAIVYRRAQGMAGIKRVMGSLRPAVVALIASAGLNMLASAVCPDGGVDAVAAVLFVLALVGLRTRRLSPICAMSACGAASLALHVLG